MKGKNQIKYSILVALPSVIGFLISSYLTLEDNQVQRIYLSTLVFQVGGGIIGSLSGFKHFPTLNTNKVAIIIILVVSFFIYQSFSVFLAGSIIAILINNLIYARKVLFSLGLGFIGAISYLFSVVSTIILDIDHSFRNEIYSMALITMTVIALFATNINKNNNNFYPFFSDIIMSILFGATNIIMTVSTSDMRLLMLDKLYLLTFSILTVNYMRVESVNNNYSLISRVNNFFNTKYDWLIIILAIILIYFETHFISLMILTYMFHLRASLYFRFVQVSRIKVNNLMLLIIPITFYFLSPVFFPLSFWATIYFITKKSFNVSNL